MFSVPTSLKLKRARRAKMDPKIDIFLKVGIGVLAILGVEKVVFRTFPKFLGKVS